MSIILTRKQFRKLSAKRISKWLRQGFCITVC
jgi:hypothetical protein